MSNNGNDDNGAREFHVETNFQNMAPRPGGIMRDQALKNAEHNIDALRPGFEIWLDHEMNDLLRIIPSAESGGLADMSWIDVADAYSQRLADVSATMDYQFMSFVANNLCMIFDAIRSGAEYHREVITCHINVLRLARQQQYRKLRSEDLPELSEGLRRILDPRRLPFQLGAKN